LLGLGPAESWFGIGSTRPRDPEPYLFTAVVTFAVSLLVADVALGALALARKPPHSVRAHPTRFAFHTSVLTTLSAVGALSLPLGSPGRAAFLIVPPDVAIVLPMLALVAGLAGFRSERPEAGVAGGSEPLLRKGRTFDAGALLAALTRCGVLAQPARSIKPVRSPATGEELWATSKVWQALAPEGTSLPPLLLESWEASEHKLLVPDLPAGSAHLLVEAMAAGGVLRGQRTVALVLDPAKSAENVRRALATLHIDAARRVAAGLADLARMRREDSCPWIVFATLPEFCALPSRLLADRALRPLAACERLCVWLGAPEPSASDLCHLGFALREFAAMRAAASSDGGICVFGEGTRTFAAWLSDLLGAPVKGRSPGFRRPEEAPSVRIGIELRATDTEDAARRAKALVAEAPPGWVAIDDRCDLLAGSTAHLPNPETASLRWVWGTPRDLVALQRECEAEPEHAARVCVFSAEATPLMRVLSDDEVGWTRDAPERRMPAISANPLIAAAHLEAMLGAGSLPEEALAWIYGRDVVNTRLSERLPRPVRGGFRVVPAPGGEKSYFRGHVWQVAGAEQQSPYRRTVTAAATKYTDPSEGHVVRCLDHANAATRLPPQSVFTANGKLYQVPGDAPRKGTDVALAAAPAGVRPNRACVKADFEWESFSEEPILVKRGSLQVALARAIVTVEESVAELLPRGSVLSQTVRIPAAAARYPTRARAIYLASVSSEACLEHLRALLEEVLPLFLAGSDDEVGVAFRLAGFGPVEGRPVLLIYDRHPKGVGLADALDEEAVFALLRWSRELLARCSCEHGCPKCVPARSRGKDKAGVLSALKTRT
jgi:hypothetical protein